MRAGNQQLDFEEFYAMQPRKIRDEYTTEDIREWFVAADLDGNGTICINEFFRWSLLNAAQKHGDEALKASFRQYDTDATGQLDALEFESVCRDMGFESVAYDIFSSLDGDSSGTVSYHELLRSLKEQAPRNLDTKRMLSALMLTYGNELTERRHKCIDTTGWTITGRDADSVKQQLQELLQQSGAQVADIIRLFDDDADLKLHVDDIEFISTMREKFGYKGEKRVLDEVFRALDADGNGVVGFDELYEFLRGHKHSLDSRRIKRLEAEWLKLMPGPQLDPRTGSIRPIGLHEIEWDEEALRILINQMLVRCGLSPADLLRAWDTDKREKDSLNRVEFVSNMRDLFDDQHDGLWEDDVRAIAESAFSTISREVKGENFLKSVGIVHLVRWLDDPPRYTALPLKSPKKRKAARRLLAQAMKQPSPRRVDVGDVALQAIAASKAKGKALAKRYEQQHLLLQQRERRLGKNGLPPLQRWETPSVEPLGLRWRAVGSSRPEHGLEVENAGLAAGLEMKTALQQKLEFDLVEFQRFNLRPLRSDSFIKSAIGPQALETYFKPVKPFTLNGMNNSASCGALALRQPRHQQRPSPRDGNAPSSSSHASLPRLERHAPTDAPSDATQEGPIGASTSGVLRVPQTGGPEVRAKPLLLLPLIDQFIDRLVKSADSAVAGQTETTEAPQSSATPQRLLRGGAKGVVPAEHRLAAAMNRRWRPRDGANSSERLPRVDSVKFGSSSIRLYKLT